jgi:hypothetical protein
MEPDSQTTKSKNPTRTVEIHRENQILIMHSATTGAYVSPPSLSWKLPHTTHRALKPYTKGTWSLILKPPKAKILPGQWRFTVKTNTRDEVYGFKARWVAIRVNTILIMHSATTGAYVSPPSLSWKLPHTTHRFHSCISQCITRRC